MTPPGESYQAMFMNQSPVALPETRNGKWMTMAPSHCPNGHGLGVGNGLWEQLEIRAG